MNIERDCVVTFHYRLSDAEGALIEDSHAGEPVHYLHGHGGIVPGLAQALGGRAAGERFTVTIAPEAGYGPRREHAVERISMKTVATRGRLRPGQRIAVETAHGTRQVTVVKPGKFMVDVDTNHPLAGRTLSFAIEILAVRAASAEERAHGHVHGVP